MESLDAIPSADYASMVTLSNQHDDTSHEIQYKMIDRQDGVNRSSQEHIYAQVTTNTPLLGQPANEIDSILCIQQEDIGTVSSGNYVQNLIRNPTVVLNQGTSPDVKHQYPNLLNFDQINYGSVRTNKGTESVAKKTTPITKDPSVFSISGRRVVVSNGLDGNSQANIQKPESSIENYNEWSSRSPLNKETGTRLQVCTDFFSLCLFIPGTVLCIISPWLLVPIYIIPAFSGSQFQTLIWISCIGSAVLVFMGCMVGNIMWFRKGSKWKCRLHCGKGPRNHYWGDSLSSKRTVNTV